MDVTLTNQLVLASTTLAASFGGYFLAGLNEYRRDRRAALRDTLNREAERQVVRTDKMHDFQLETLIALQEALQLMVRLNGRAMHFDHMQARLGKCTQLPEEWSDEMHENGVNVNVLVGRIVDDNIRELVSQFHDHASVLSVTPRDLGGLVGDELERVAMHNFMELNEAYEVVAHSIGEAIREELVWNTF